MQNTISSNTNINEAVKDRLKDSMDTISIATKAVDSVVKSIIKMTDNVNAKQLIGSNFKMKKISKLTSQYMGIVGEIINALIVPDNSKYESISQLAGYIKQKSTQKDSDGKIIKVDPEYRNLDALLKIIGITNDIMKAIDSLSKSDIAMRSFINFRVNLARTTKMMKIMVREIFKSLQSIANDPSIKKIMDMLVGDPEKVVETMIDNSKEENWDMKVDKDFDKGSKSIKDILQETTTIKQRKGIVDVIQGIFETLKLILELQLPHPLAFKLKMRRARLCYMNAFSSIKQMANEISADDGAKSIQLLGDILRGTGRNGDDGLVGTITNLYQILDMMGEMGRPSLAKKLNRFSKKHIPEFRSIIIDLINIFTEDSTKKKIEELISGSTQKKIEKISEVINSIDSIIMDLLKLSAKLMLIGSISSSIIAFSPFIRVFIETIKWFIKGLNKLVGFNVKTISEKLNDINDIIKSLLAISGLLIALGTLATPAIAAMIIDTVFMGALLVLVLITDKLLNIINRIINKDSILSLIDLQGLLLSLITIGSVIILLALVAIPAIAGMVLSLLFLGSLILFIDTAKLLVELISRFITVNTILAMLELILFLSVLIVIASIMLVFAVLVKPATKACWLGILFVIGLIALTALLTVLGALAFSLTSIIGMAILGLLAINVLLITMIPIAIILIAMSALFNMISPALLIRGLVTMLFVVPLAIAIGIIGLGSIIAIPGALLTTILVSLILIIAASLTIMQSLDLNMSQLTKKIETIKTSVNAATDAFSKTNVFGLLKSIFIVNIAIPLVNRLVSLGRKLRKLQRFSLDRKKVISNVQAIFDTVREIENQIKMFSGIVNEEGKVDIKSLAKNTLDNIVKGISTKKKMDRSDTILVKVYSIAKKLNKIQNIKLEWDKIKNNLNVCFNTVDAILDYVNGRDSVPKDDQDVVKEEINNANLSVFDKLKFKTKKKQLRKSDLILGQVYNIVKTLQDIEKIKLDDKTIVSKVSKLLDVVESIDTEISNRLNISDAEKMTAMEKRAMRRSLRFENKMKNLQAQNVDKMTVIISNVSEMVDIMKNLKTLKFDKDTVVKNAGIIFDAAEEIHQLITKRFSNPVDDTNFNTVMSHVRLANEEITGLSKLTDKELANTKNTLDYYTNFLTKIDGLKVENLKESVHIFKHMARFSESISGNFEKLSESINEDLMPVLEELKKIMAQVPEAVEKSSANISASVAANNNNQLSKSENIAQIQRENPNISEPEAVKKALERTQQQAAKQADSVSAKIDKLISMLSNGSAKVKTSIW